MAQEETEQLPTKRVLLNEKELVMLIDALDCFREYQEGAEYHANFALQEKLQIARG
jgi:hypothetical protein